MTNSIRHEQEQNAVAGHWSNHPRLKPPEGRDTIVGQPSYTKQLAPVRLDYSIESMLLKGTITRKEGNKSPKNSVMLVNKKFDQL